MSKIGFSLEGDEEFLRNLIRLGDAWAGQSLATAAQRGAQVLEMAAEPMAPGPNLVTEVVEQIPGKVTVAIGPDKAHWYYQFFETGVSPHEIPSAKKDKGKIVLHFAGGPDGETFAFSVDHPGMSASPFLRPAVDTQKQAAVDAVGAELARVMVSIFKTR